MMLFDEIPHLETEHLILRRITERDESAIAVLAEDASVKRYLPAFLAEEQAESPKQALNRFYGELFQKKESLFLGIYRKADPEALAGIGEFYACDLNRREVSIGCRLLPACWGGGIGKEAIAALMEYAVHTAGIRVIHSEIMPQNTASCRIAESLGYRLVRAGAEEDWGLPEKVKVNEYEYRADE